MNMQPDLQPTDLTDFEIFQAVDAERRYLESDCLPPQPWWFYLKDALTYPVLAVLVGCSWLKQRVLDIARSME
jgi:hypothetical protein